jgi:glycogen operon protein
MDGSIIEFANMMKRQNEAYGFVNYAANNNGFTLRDVYSYSEKHNDSNGEENRDGDNYNFSHNYGQEGETKSKAIQNIRITHIRTALTTVLTGQGIPLLLAGDEAGNSQQGNNNAYCQDNELAWTEFSRQKRFRELRKFTKNMIAFRKEHKVLSLPKPMEMSDYKHKGIPDLSYHGKEPWTMWLSDDMKSIGILYDGAYAGEESDVMLLFNFYFGEDSFALPKLNGRRKWYEIMNTTDGEFKSVLLKNQKEQIVPGGSVTILVGKKEH